MKQTSGRRQCFSLEADKLKGNEYCDLAGDVEVIRCSVTVVNHVCCLVSPARKAWRPRRRKRRHHCGDASHSIPLELVPLSSISLETIPILTLWMESVLAHIVYNAFLARSAEWQNLDPP